ncbi:hypothetical protein AB0H69_09550 [Streptomyces phaeochromogenes]|uniref:hypothetical protein n=1 Tax=Streptomyces phaeochromogenes TaxID=1923 RepID=UPI0033CF6EEE
MAKPTSKRADQLKVGDRLKLWNGQTTEVLEITDAVGQHGKKSLILTLYRAPKMPVKPYRMMTMYYPED